MLLGKVRIMQMQMLLGKVRIMQMLMLLGKVKITQPLVDRVRQVLVNKIEKVKMFQFKSR